MDDESVRQIPGHIGQICNAHFSMPFAFLRLCREFPRLFGVKENYEYWRQIQREHVSIIQLYETISDREGVISARMKKEKNKKNTASSEDSIQHPYLLRILGLLNFDFGDMGTAEGYFDGLDNPALMDEFYLLLTAHTLWKDTSAILTYALNLANNYKGRDNRELYYKARLLLEGNQPQEEGIRLLEELADYLPAQYLLLSFTKGKDREEGIQKVGDFLNSNSNVGGVF